jgi:hypothetical protein
VNIRFEAELSRHLKPTAAPEELWTRIQAGHAAGPRTAPRWPLLLFASAVLAMAILFGLIPRFKPAPDVSKAAWRELTAGSRIDFRSNDPEQIRAWVKTHAGLNVPLAAGHSVQFVGASLLHDSDCTVCISFHGDNGAGKLVIARGGADGPLHPSLRQTSYRGAHVVSWVAGGQAYALASTPKENAHAGCVLCHMDRSGQA